MLKRTLIALTIILAALPALACVGKSLAVGTDQTPESKAVAQILAILINERTGTTVEIIDHKDYDALMKEMTQGDIDLALDYTGRALKREGTALPGDPKTALEKVREIQMEKHNLVWLAPLGFTEPGIPESVAAPIAQKHALKKFPALSRLIAKTSDMITPGALKEITASANMARAAREFLKKNKLI